MTVSATTSKLWSSFTDVSDIISLKIQTDGVRAAANFTYIQTVKHGAAQLPVYRSFYREDAETKEYDYRCVGLSFAACVIELPVDKSREREASRPVDATNISRKGSRGKR